MRRAGILVVCTVVGLACSDSSSVSGPQQRSPQTPTVATTRDGIPKPKLVLDSRTPTPYDNAVGDPYLMYSLSVRNSESFPDALFTSAPLLPPCGLNSASSRSWVSIYDDTDTYIYGFCGLMIAAELNDIWFAVPVGGAVPKRVYITIWDRATGATYTSNSVPIP